MDNFTRTCRAKFAKSFSMTCENKTTCYCLFHIHKRMTDAFSVDKEHLILIMKAEKNKDKALVQTINSTSIRKFCEMCLVLNIDPLHKWSLHLIIILMCKNSSPMDVAKKFAQDIGHAECVENIEKGPQMYDLCSSICSTMTDWISLFGFLNLKCIQNLSEKSTYVTDAMEIESYKQFLGEVETNECLKRMTHALTEAQVVGENLTPTETALWSFIYMSPRTTPAGSMLERMYSSINSNARDSELRCLRAMSMFNDKVDATFTENMSLVLRCFDVKENFRRIVESILREKKEVVMAKGEKTIRPLLRTYAASAVHSKILKTSSENWSIWRGKANFPITTSTYVQKLLYFICVQVHSPDANEYESLYHTDLLKRVSQMKVHDIDVTCVIEVMNNLRTYYGDISNLIDFRHKCLFGINEKARQQLTLTEVLKLYISIHQHPSIIETCWRHVIPVFNHTIRMNIEEFKTQHSYQSSQVVKNLVRNILD